MTLLWTGSQSTLGSLLGVVNELLSACVDADAELVVLGGKNVYQELPEHPRIKAFEWNQDLEFEYLNKAQLTHALTGY